MYTLPGFDGHRGGGRGLKERERREGKIAEGRATKGAWGQKRKTKAGGGCIRENDGERSGVTFLIVSRPAAFCFGVYAS